MRFKVFFLSSQFFTQFQGCTFSSNLSYCVVVTNITSINLNLPPQECNYKFLLLSYMYCREIFLHYQHHRLPLCNLFFLWETSMALWALFHTFRVPLKLSPTINNNHIYLCKVWKKKLASIYRRNHVHLTVRLGFVTQHLWLGNFGKCNQGLRARTLRLRYLKSSVTFPFS